MKVFVNRKEFDISDPEFYKKIIEDQQDLLEKYKTDGRKPTEHLLQDIRIYKFILKSKNPVESAKQYLDKMHELRTVSGFNVKKIDAIRALGWEVE